MEKKLTYKDGEPSALKGASSVRRGVHVSAVNAVDRRLPYRSESTTPVQLQYHKILMTLQNRKSPVPCYQTALLNGF